MRKIPLTHRKFALVDDEDFEELNQYKWHVGKNRNTFYARAWVKGKRTTMHRLILKAKKGQIVDHINMNGLDNRKYNLRLVSYQQNNWNRRRRKQGTSKYIGVCWYAKHKKWYAQIGHNGHTIYLGQFETQVAAARVYDEAAKKYRGEFAITNFK